MRDTTYNMILVQSDKKGCPHLLNSVDRHLDVMGEKIDTLTDEEFKKNVQAVLTEIEEKDNN